MEELLSVNDFGFCLGYKVKNLSLYDYNFGITDAEIINETIATLKNQKITEFIFIEELFIEPEYRNYGYGKELFINFLEQYKEKDIPILLFAGSSETPESMDIVSFYEFFGFDVLIKYDISPLMNKDYF
jgi:GNAT superfamily N-acetyltransferase